MTARTLGTVRWGGTSWLVQTEPHVAIKLKRHFPKLGSAAQFLYKLSDTPENARDLLWFLQRFPMVVEGEERLRARAAEHEAQEKLVDDIVMGRAEARPFELAVPAREYQRLAATMLLASGSLLLCDDLGLGKTVSAIATFCDPTTLPAVVVTETALPLQWQRMIARFAPKLWTAIIRTGKPKGQDDWGICRGRHPFGADAEAPGKARCTVCGINIEDAFAGRRAPDVYVMSYSKLAGWADKLGRLARSVVFDEVQNLRHEGTDRYKSAETLRAGARYCMGLTATPVYNQGAEIFNVLSVVRPGGLGDWGEFRTEWCSGYGQDVSGYGIRDPKAFGTYARETGMMLRRTRIDVGRELPPLQNVRQPCDADLSTLDHVGSACAELARFLLGQGPNPLSGSEDAKKKGLMQMQAAEQFINKLRQATGLAKAVFVAQFVRLLVEAGEPVVLFGWHRAVYDVWMDRLKDLRPALYTGSENAQEKMAAVSSFTEGPEEGRSKVLIISLRSGAGLDGLQHACRTVVHGELDWSPKVHDQCTGRVSRDGQPHPVVAYYMVADSGSDPIVEDVLGLKEAQSRGILDPMAELVEKTDPNAEQHAKRLAEAYLAQREAKSGKGGVAA